MPADHANQAFWMPGNDAWPDSLSDLLNLSPDSDKTGRGGAAQTPSRSPDRPAATDQVPPAQQDPFIALEEAAGHTAHASVAQDSPNASAEPATDAEKATAAGGRLIDLEISSPYPEQSGESQ